MLCVFVYPRHPGPGYRPMYDTHTHMNTYTFIDLSYVHTHAYSDADNTSEYLELTAHTYTLNVTLSGNKNEPNHPTEPSRSVPLQAIV
jgi:hypothetical protein